MKKVIGILAVAMMALAACNKDQTGSTSIPAPTNPDNHFHFIADPSAPQNGMKNQAGEDDKLMTLTISPGRSGVIQYEKAGTKGFDFEVTRPTRAVSVQTGVKFAIKGLGPVKQVAVRDITTRSIVEATLEVTVGSQVVMITGTIVEEPPYTGLRQDLCRNWEIEETILAVKGDGISAELGVGKKFTGCKLEEISEYMVEKGVKVETLGSDYNVAKIMIDPSGKFAIFFQGMDPYYGDYTLKGDSFSYSFTIYDEDNPVIAGSARGRLSIAKGYGRMELNSDLKDNKGSAYSVNVILKLKPETKPLYL